MRIFGKSDIGRRRSSNQDDYAFGRLGSSAVWAAVCDGMGGANGGNVASAMAVREISRHIESDYREGCKPNSIKTLLQSAVYTANAEIYEEARKNEALAGMGTTVVAAGVADKLACIAHVGDSRAYLIHEDAICQITRDHSVVQEMVEAGQITQEEARAHPNKNVITRALGIVPEIAIDYSEVTLQRGDALILCTDGLSNQMEADEIKNIVKAGVEDACARLVTQANARGGPDNITVVLLSDR